MGAWGKSRRSERTTERHSERKRHGHKSELNTQSPKENLKQIHLPQGTQCGRLEAASQGKIQINYWFFKSIFDLPRETLWSDLKTGRAVVS
jgi:hypothetical protein